ncbi:MAG: CaiB/BaiF CoA transferase family protein, partial [Gammaproteobacteria bacterium]
TGQPEGEHGAGPMKVGVALTDILTGLHASTAILAALAWRERSGKGQHIDLALLDVQVACLANQAMNYLYSGNSPKRLGNAHPNVVPYQDFPTADGHMLLAVGNDEQFRKLCEALGRPELAEDPRYTRNAARIIHRETLIPELREETRKRSTRAWIALLETLGVPCGPINGIAEVFADPQVEARGMQIRVSHPQAGEIPLVASPLRFSETPVSYRRAPPGIGEHTAEVLAEWLQSDATDAGMGTPRR